MNELLISLRELHLFAGAGGGILGGMLLGHTTVCAVEIEPYCQQVLLQRQRDGILPKFPIWGDITTFDARPWRGLVDVVCGGFPCQDVSCAGKGAGIEGARSGLWGEMARVVREVGPRYVLVENSPMLTLRGLGRVLGDLAEMGYNAKWCVLGADDTGAPHRRKRIWILADSNNRTGCSEQRRQPEMRSERIDQRREAGSTDVADARHLQGRNGAESDEQESTQTSGHREMDNAPSEGLEGTYDNGKSSQRIQPEPSQRREEMAHPTSQRQSGQGQSWYASDPAEAGEGETDRAWTERVGHIWGVESRLGRVANGVADRMDRLTATGNGQVPSVVALAWRALTA